MCCAVNVKYFFCRTWSSYSTGMWDSLRNSWSNMCLPIAACEDEVHNLYVTLFGLLWLFCLILLLGFRMQAQRSNTNMAHVFRRTFQHEGFRGFYKGIFPNMLKAVPSAGISYLVYETMKKRLHLEWRIIHWLWLTWLTLEDAIGLLLWIKSISIFVARSWYFKGQNWPLPVRSKISNMLLYASNTLFF